MVTGNKARKRNQSRRWPCWCCGRWWEHTLCCVQSVINGVTNESQVWKISKGCRTKYMFKMCIRRGVMWCEKHEHWQADCSMFYADVITGCWDAWQELVGKMGGLAVRRQRCVELKTFLLSWGREEGDGLNRAEGVCWVRWERCELGGDCR